MKTIKINKIHVGEYTRHSHGNPLNGNWLKINLRRFELRFRTYVDAIALEYTKRAEVQMSSFDVNFCSGRQSPKKEKRRESFFVFLLPFFFFLGGGLWQQNPLKINSFDSFFFFFSKMLPASHLATSFCGGSDDGNHGDTGYATPKAFRRACHGKD